MANTNRQTYRINRQICPHSLQYIPAAQKRGKRDDDFLIRLGVADVFDAQHERDPAQGLGGGGDRLQIRLLALDSPGEVERLAVAAFDRRPGGGR